MFDAHIAIELHPADQSAEKVLFSLEQEFRSFGSLRCTVIRKREFKVEGEFEKGASLAMKKALEIDSPWSVYIAPRRFEIAINRTKNVSVPATFIAMARSRRAAAFFVHTVTEEAIPEPLFSALSRKVDEMRRLLVTTELSDRDEVQLDVFRKSIETAYMKALSNALVQ